MEVDRDAGWGLNRRSHFDEIVAPYDRIRPAYPDRLISDIMDFVGTDTKCKALEIGAGTGKATAAFLDAGYDVTAVEIGEHMADFLRNRFRGGSGFRVITSAFEDAPLEDCSYDLIYAASAFHWVNPEIGCPKALRLLKNGGVLALFRYHAVPADGDVLNGEMQAVYEKHYYKPYVKPARKTEDAYWQPAEIREGFGFEDLSSYGFTDIAMQLYHTVTRYNAEEHIAMLETFSDHRSLPESDRSALLAGIKEAIVRHGGFLDVDYTFQLYVGKKPPA